MNINQFLNFGHVNDIHDNNIAIVAGNNGKEERPSDYCEYEDLNELKKRRKSKGGNKEKPLFTDKGNKKANQITKEQVEHLEKVFEKHGVDVMDIPTTSGMAMNLLTAVYQKWSADGLVDEIKVGVNIKGYYRFLVNDCKFTFKREESNVEKQLKKSIQGEDLTSILSQN